MGKLNEVDERQLNLNKIASLRKEIEKNLDIVRECFSKKNRNLAALTVGNSRYDTAEALLVQLNDILFEMGEEDEEIPKLGDILKPRTEEDQKAIIKASSP